MTASSPSTAGSRRTIRPGTIRRLFGRFGVHLRPYWRVLLVAWVYMLGSTVMELLRPWPIKLLFDHLLIPQADAGSLAGGWLSGWSPNAVLALIALSILGIAVMGGLFSYGETYLVSSVGQKVAAAIRQQLFHHVQRLSRTFHDAHRSGDLLVRLTTDIAMLRELMVGTTLFISEHVLVLVGMIAIMGWMDWSLTLIALAILPVLLLVAFRFSGKIKEATKRQRRKEGQIASVLSERISAIALVQAFARERHESERFLHHDTASLKAGLKAMRLEAMLHRLVEMVLAVGTCAVLWLGVTKVLAGRLTPGDLLVFLAYVTGLYKPIRRLASHTSRLAKASTCGERVLTVLETEPDITDAPDAVVAPRFQGEIVFQNVDFWYDPAVPILRGVSFTIRPGQTVALVGPSGVGKSTIANLLLRFYDPQQGRILLDGIDIRRYTLASLRAQIAFIFQEAVLFRASVQENIAYGKLDATRSELLAAAHAGNAHDFIERLEQGYDTVVGERGATLSGGQRQRIAIARAIIRNTPILILDEPMTGLDVESETKVRASLKRLMNSRTCLLITHDLQAVEAADQVLVLEEGRIVEHGRHRELVARSQRYRALCELNAGRPAPFVMEQV